MKERIRCCTWKYINYENSRNEEMVFKQGIIDIVQWKTRWNIYLRWQASINRFLLEYSTILAYCQTSIVNRNIWLKEILPNFGLNIDRSATCGSVYFCFVLNCVALHGRFSFITQLMKNLDKSSIDFFGFTKNL